MLRSLLVVTAAFVLVPVGTAAAGTAAIDGTTLRYLSAPGEFNELNVNLSSGRFVIQDGTSGNRTTLPVTLLAPCQLNDVAWAGDLIDGFCPATGITAIAVDLDDANDSASFGNSGGLDYPVHVGGADGADRIWAGPQADDVRGDAGNDTLTGNGGRDYLSGGTGDDTIIARDGLTDTVVCGPGNDSVTADTLDIVADDCETITRGPGEPPVVPSPSPVDPYLPPLLPLGTATGTAAIDGTTLRYLAAPGEFNELSINRWSGRFVIQDGTSGNRSTVPVTFATPCQRDDSPWAGSLIDGYCPARSVGALSVDLADANDTASFGANGGLDYPVRVDGGDGTDRIWAGPRADDVRGDAGNDTLTGNGGRDYLSGGTGDDTIIARDGFTDTVVCGPGNDSVTANPLDTVADDCETTITTPGRPPRVVLRSSRSPSLSGLQTKGLHAVINCEARCSARSEAWLSQPNGFSRPTTGSRGRIAFGTARRTAAGSLSVVNRLGPKTARRLRLLRRSRTVHLVLQVMVTVNGSTVILRRTVTVR